jgi:hypothetical protein
VVPPDYDHDGRVSMAEAHAYVMLTSETVDIPVCTSDVLLRQFSRTQDSRIKGLAAASIKFDELVKLATPDRRAVLEGLSKQLELKGDDRAAAARTMAESIDRERRRYDRRGGGGGGGGEREDLRRKIKAAVLVRWPEMSSAWHPVVTKALAQEPEAIVKLIESQPGFARWDELSAKAGEASTKSFELERKWVKCQRFLYTAESVALAANLDKFATKLVQQRYEELRAAENSTFGKSQ